MSESLPAAAVPEEAPLLRPPKFTEEIDNLLASVTDHPVALRDLLVRLKGRAYLLLLIFLSMPFCLPLPLPGLSTAFGTVISLIGIQFALRREPWLPERLLRKTISPTLLRRVLLATRKLAKAFELLLRPRLVGLVDWTIAHRINGAIIFLAGFLLLLPLPVPLTNIVPCVCIILMAAGMLERDGRVIILGMIAFVLNVCFFSSIFMGGAKAIYLLNDWFSGMPPEVPIPADLPPPAPNE